MSDNYTEGFCKRCGLKRTECQKIIDAGKRCTEVRGTDPEMPVFPYDDCLDCGATKPKGQSCGCHNNKCQ